MEPFHKRLKRLRQAKGWTMKSFARAIQVPISTYRDWEYGGAIQGQPYIKIALALEVSISELMTGEKNRDTKVLQLLEKLENLNREIKKELLPFC
jgi:transcriptional regulator with XRE-family HTH domain